jgi:hypothetical protein
MKIIRRHVLVQFFDDLDTRTADARVEVFNVSKTIRATDLPPLQQRRFLFDV